MVNGFTPVTGFIARIIVDRSRSWRGPWRGPGLLVVPASHGTPTSPISTSSMRGEPISRCGRRMKLGMPAKRGISIADTGMKNWSSDILALLCHGHFAGQAAKVEFCFNLRC